MKKNKGLAFISSILILFSLASCNNGKIYPAEGENETQLTNANNVVPGGEEASYKTQENEEGEYGSISVDFTNSDEPSIPTDIEKTVEAVYDSVVSINVTANSFTGSGSGVLFSHDDKFSYIVTCFHVIDKAYKYDVKLSNGETYSASLVGGYEKNDLAVLCINKTGLTYAPLFSNSDNLKLGSTVVCIGNPLGTLPGSVSSGVLSYVNREVNKDSYTKLYLLQTDVAINSGNSGGGLFNTSGALIGIVNAKYSSSTIEGLGFAIPSNSVRDVVSKILETAEYNETSNNWHEGYYEGDWALGFSISNGWYTTGSGWGAISHSCVYISEISSNPTASKGLLAAQSIITKVRINHAGEIKELNTINDASSVLSFIYSANLKLGDTITLTVANTDITSTNDVEVTLIQYIYQD